MRVWRVRVRGRVWMMSMRIVSMRIVDVRVVVMKPTTKQFSFAAIVERHLLV